MVPGPAALASPGNLLERQMLGLPRIRNLMNQKLWGWSPSVCVLMKPQSDSEYTKVWEPPLKCYLLEMCVSVSSAKRNLTSTQHWANGFSEFKKGILCTVFRPDLQVCEGCQLNKIQSLNYIVAVRDGRLGVLLSIIDKLYAFVFKFL